MFNGDKQKTAEFCVKQFQQFLDGMRSWDADTLDYAEIHSAALFLCEDGEFEQLLRKEWSSLRTYQSSPQEAVKIDYLADVAPDLIQGFFYALREYAELYRGEPS